MPPMMPPPGAAVANLGKRAIPGGNENGLPNAPEADKKIKENAE